MATVRVGNDLIAIAADDWDAVVRYVGNKPAPKKLPFAKKTDEEIPLASSVISGKCERGRHA